MIERRLAPPPANLLLAPGVVPDADVLRDTAVDAVTLDATNGEWPFDGAALSGMPLGARVPALHLRLPTVTRGEDPPPLDGLNMVALKAVLLRGIETPQQVRDADVFLRTLEQPTPRVEPGQVRLIPEIASARGLLALPAILEATDRCGAVALHMEQLTDDLGLPRPIPTSGLDPYFAAVAIASAAADLPWLLLAPSVTAGARALLAERARAHGAAGCYVTNEAEVRGLQALFEPRPARKSR